MTKRIKNDKILRTVVMEVAMKPEFQVPFANASGITLLIMLFLHNLNVSEK